MCGGVHIYLGHIVREVVLRAGGSSEFGQAAHDKWPITTNYIVDKMMSGSDNQSRPLLLLFFALYAPPVLATVYSALEIFQKCNFGKSTFIFEEFFEYRDSMYKWKPLG